MAKAEPKKVAIDSGLLIARITGDRPEHAPGIATLFHEADSQKVKLFGSTLLFPEVLGGGYDDPVDPAKENAIFRVLDNPSVITMVQVTRQVAVLARDLRRELHLKTADATHLASAVFAGVDMFMTIDENDFTIGSTVRGVEIALPGSALGEDALPLIGPG
ncbi:type II toxin-antitoxin system VapC family toxin [Desertihabitans aurantiacus]|uniref:type II toxin-antitoxin system VapC family toxin n=1 Tax=Desertihabitans aurantiacus TaxID=2282477 RepID=UPI000DF7EF9A|nr:PIN domain-containing protein [Desertihabitans aurantiacus]